MMIISGLLPRGLIPLLLEFMKAESVHVLGEEDNKDSCHSHATCYRLPLLLKVGI
jgi:hypothetical protein